MRRRPNVGLQLGQRRRWRVYSETTLGRRLMFAGNDIIFKLKLINTLVILHLGQISRWALLNVTSKRDQKSSKQECTRHYSASTPRVGIFKAIVPWCETHNPNMLLSGWRWTREEMLGMF